MQFKDFLKESFSKEYSYRVRIAADLTDEHVDIIESALGKYSLTNMASFKRLPIQENPVEFVRAKGVKFTSSINSTDITLKYPANPRILEVWLAVHLGLDTNHVLVYEVNDPRRSESERAEERLANDEDRYVTEEDSFLADEEYSTEEAVDHDDYYGEGFNKKFLDAVAKIKKEKGSSYFRSYPSKDEIMGDNLRPMWDELNNRPNMGKGETSKEQSVISQSLGH